MSKQFFRDKADFLNHQEFSKDSFWYTYWHVDRV